MIRGEFESDEPKLLAKEGVLLRDIIADLRSAGVVDKHELYQEGVRRLKEEGFDLTQYDINNVRAIFMFEPASGSLEKLDGILMGLTTDEDFIDCDVITSDGFLVSELSSDTPSPGGRLFFDDLSDDEFGPSS